MRHPDRSSKSLIFLTDEPTVTEYTLCRPVYEGACPDADRPDRHDRGMQAGSQQEVRMSKDWIERSMEPSIEELLSDPICRRIMQSDGLTESAEAGVQPALRR